MSTKSDEMKIIPTLSALFLSVGLSGQTSDAVKIKASDPTQLYTFLEGYVGLNILGSWEYGPSEPLWEADFRGN